MKTQLQRHLINLLALFEQPDMDAELFVHRGLLLQPLLM